MGKKLTTGTQVSLLVTALVALASSSLVAEGMSNLKPKSNSENQEQRELLIIVRDKQLLEREPERVAKAIERLGEIRSIAAIDDLVDLLTFRRIFEWDSERNGILDEPHFISITGRYPAAGALFQIGKPALPALIKVIETEKTGSLRGENAIYTVTQIFRDSPTEGVAYLRDSAANASSAKAARRLSDAAERVKRFHQQ